MEPNLELYAYNDEDARGIGLRNNSDQDFILPAGESVQLPVPSGNTAKDFRNMLFAR